MKYFILATFIFLNMTSIALGQEVVAKPGGLMGTITYYAEVIAQLCFGIMIVATLAVRLTPGTKDDEAVNSVWKMVHKVLAYLPTFGINPRTKKLEEALNVVNKSGDSVEKPKEESAEVPKES